MNTARYIVVAALIVGLVLGAGVGYLAIPPVTKTVTETLTTTKTEFVTLTQTVVTVKEKTKTVTETKTVTFTPPKPPASFTLLNYSVAVKADTPVLYVQFKTTAPLTLKLIGPDGVRKDSKEVYPGELGVYLELASPFETPIPGKYVLEATTYEGSVIYSTEIELSEPKIAILNVESKIRVDEMLGPILEVLTVEVVNSGSLPTFVVDSVVVVNNVPYPVPLEPTPILPGEKTELTIPVYQTLETLPAKITVSLINDKHVKIAEKTFTTE